MASKKIKYKFSKSNIIYILLIMLLSLILVFLALENTRTLDYRNEFKRIYTSVEKDKFSEVYIDLVNGFYFVYPRSFVVQEDIYFPGKFVDGLSKGNSNLLSLTGNSTKFDLKIYKINKQEDLLKFAKKTEVFNFRNLLGNVSFSEITINNNFTVLSEFIITQEDKNIEIFSRGFNQKIIDYPIGMKGKIYYIQDEDYVFVWSTSFEEEVGLEKEFDQIVESFDFIN